MSRADSGRRAPMGGQNIPVWSKLRSGWQVYLAHRRNVFSNAEVAVRYHRNLVEYLRAGTGLAPAEASILDLGCGQQAVQTVLFHAEGARVVGVDVEVPTFRMNPAVLLQTVRLNGVERGLKSVARRLLVDGRFFRDLAREAGRPLDLEAVDVRIMDAGDLSFPDRSFDFVVSTAVFEHIEDVRGAAREVNRVLGEGGLAVITPHLFPSLSGGHNLEWAEPDRRPSLTVPPWDHLRAARYPANVYLNRLKWSDYRRILGEELLIEAEVPEREGRALLTPKLESELGARGYSREDLTTKTVMFFCRRRREP